MARSPQHSGGWCTNTKQQLVTFPVCDKEKESTKTSQKQLVPDSSNAAKNSDSHETTSTQDKSDSSTRKRSWNWVNPNYVRTLPANLAAIPDDGQNWCSDPMASEFGGGVDHQSSHKIKTDPFVEWGSHELNGGTGEASDRKVALAEDEDDLE